MGEKSDYFPRISSICHRPPQGLRATTEEISTNSTTRAESSMAWHIKVALIDSRCSEVIYLVTCSGLPHQTSKAWCKKVRGNHWNHQTGCSHGRRTTITASAIYQYPCASIIVQLMGSWYVSRHGIGSTRGKRCGNPAVLVSRHHYRQKIYWNKNNTHLLHTAVKEFIRILS